MEPQARGARFRAVSILGCRIKLLKGPNANLIPHVPTVPGAQRVHGKHGPDLVRGRYGLSKGQQRHFADYALRAIDTL